MQKKVLVPDSIRAPFGNYSHGVLVSQYQEMLLVSGQLGVSKDDATPDDAYGQAIVCFENIQSVLLEGGMDFSNVVKVSAFVTSHDAFMDYMRARDRFITNPPPASTLLIVSGFTRPEFQVEVEVVACR